MTQRSSDMVERVARAIIDANDRRERSATHGMEIVAVAALEASHHAELVDELKRLAGFLVIILGSPGYENLREAAQRHLNAGNALLAKIGGGQ